MANIEVAVHVLGSHWILRQNTTDPNGRRKKIFNVERGVRTFMYSAETGEHDLRWINISRANRAVIHSALSDAWSEAAASLTHAS